MKISAFIFFSFLPCHHQHWWGGSSGPPEGFRLLGESLRFMSFRLLTL